MLKNMNWKRLKALLSAGAILLTLSGCRRPGKVEVTPTPIPSESVAPTQSKQPDPTTNVVPSPEPSNGMGDVRPNESDAPTVTTEPSPVVTPTPVPSATTTPNLITPTPEPSPSATEIVMPTDNGNVVIVIPTPAPSAEATPDPVVTPDPSTPVDPVPTANPEHAAMQKEATKICADIDDLINESILLKNKLYEKVKDLRSFCDTLNEKYQQLLAIQKEANDAYNKATGSKKTSILKEKEKIDSEVAKVKQELDAALKELDKLVELNKKYTSDGNVSHYKNVNNELKAGIDTITSKDQLQDYQQTLNEMKEYVLGMEYISNKYTDKKKDSVLSGADASITTATTAKDSIHTIESKREPSRRPSTSTPSPKPSDKPVDPTPSDKPIDPTPSDEPTEDPDKTYDEDGNIDNVYGYVYTLKINV